MKAKKCPYCGRRISYYNLFDNKKKGEYICRRCGKESRIMIRKSIYTSFLVAVILSAVIIVGWIGLGFANNPWGILLVAVPLVIFYLMTPRFIRILPLKKYKKSMEAAKAAREYSSEMKFKQNYGNNINRETENISTVNSGENNFSINEDIFNSIKTNRKKPDIGENITDENTPADATVIVKKDENDRFVPIIENNREAHASSSENVPLQRIHKEKITYSQAPYENERFYEEKKTPSETDKRKKYEGSKYSANRRF